MHMPVPEKLPSVASNDKLIHFTLYFVLVLLWGMAMRCGGHQLTGRVMIFAWVGFGLYAAMDEWLQGFVNRSPDMRDWLADKCGITASLALIYAWGRFSCDSADESTLSGPKKPDKQTG